MKKADDKCTLEESTREIGPVTVRTMGHETPLHHLAGIQLVVSALAARQNYRPLLIVEVGTWVGESAIAMALAAPCGSDIVCVDTFHGNSDDWTNELAAAVSDQTDSCIMDICETNLEAASVAGGCCVTFSIINRPSLFAANNFGSYGCHGQFCQRKIDLLYLDASHDYESVAADIKGWLPHIAAGGVISGHDYEDGFPGVQKAVHKLLDDGLHIEVVDKTSVWHGLVEEKTCLDAG